MLMASDGVTTGSIGSNDIKMMIIVIIKLAIVYYWIITIIIHYLTIATFPNIYFQLNHQ